MPDPQFFKRQSSFSLKDLADITDAQLSGNADPNFVVDDVAALDVAEQNHVSFLDNPKYRDQFENTKAGACFVSEKTAEFAPSHVHLLISPSPYKSYALAAQSFYPDTYPESEIAETVSIHPDAQIGENCTIEHGAVIKSGAKIGNDCWIEACAIIGENVEIGRHCRIGSHVTISHSIIGNNVRFYPGVRIGQDGFGFAPDPQGFVKVPQLGRVIIEDNVEIGANTTIDRGSGPDTVIGEGTWIDNLVQIGHNAKIGKKCILVAQVGISGSTVIEDYVAIGGQAGIAGHLHIGMAARIAAQSGVIRDIPPREEYMGTPAVPSKQFFRQNFTLKQLIQKNKKA